MKDSTQRFTEVVENYAKFRPSYPIELCQVLEEHCGLTPQSIIADIGSGTGLLTKLLLDHGNPVLAVEPNDAMRAVAEQLLQSYPQFQSIAGTAEATTLPDHSVNLITVATAFHWFDPVKTKREFQRILQTPGYVALIWNVRNLADSALQQEYENLIVEYGSDYKTSSAQKFEKTAVQAFFNPYEMQIQKIPYAQHFDWDGFKGRLLSTSYSLKPDDKRYDAMLNDLRKIFDRYQVNNQIEFLYHTTIYYGQFA
jgi:ubiquinone/menaquinone biosynthesis C-methylase UbiE